MNIIVSLLHPIKEIFLATLSSPSIQLRIICFLFSICCVESAPIDFDIISLRNGLSLPHSLHACVCRCVCFKWSSASIYWLQYWNLIILHHRQFWTDENWLFFTYSHPPESIEIGIFISLFTPSDSLQSARNALICIFFGSEIRSNMKNLRRERETVKWIEFFILVARIVWRLWCEATKWTPLTSRRALFGTVDKFLFVFFIFSVLIIAKFVEFILFISLTVSTVHCRIFANDSLTAPCMRHFGTWHERWT